MEADDYPVEIFGESCTVTVFRETGKKVWHARGEFKGREKKTRQGSPTREGAIERWKEVVRIDYNN